MRRNHPEAHLFFLSLSPWPQASLSASESMLMPPPTTTTTTTDAEDSRSLAPAVVFPPLYPIFPRCHCVSVNKSFIFPFTSTSRHLFPPLPAVLYKPGVVHNGNGWGLSGGVWRGEGLGHLSSVAVFGEGRMCGKGVGGSARSRQSSGVLRGNCFFVALHYQRR